MTKKYSKTGWLGAALLTITIAASAQGQAAPIAPPKLMTATEKTEHYERDSVDRVYPLHYASSQNAQNEIVTALRNMLDAQTRIFLVPSSSVIAIHAPEEVQERAAKLLSSLDHADGLFRLTYTLTEMDGNRKIGVQHFAMVVLAGQRGQLKQGSRVPITLGEAQSTYIDIGVNFDATLSPVQGGGVLRSKIEQTGIAPDSTTPTNPNPVIRQTLLEGTISLLTGKSALLGSLDVPSSTRHFNVEVTMEPVN